MTVRRKIENGNREATILDNGGLRVMIDDLGGMIPELSAERGIGEDGPKGGSGRLNAHWLPWFRSNSGKPFKEDEDAAFWKAKLLHHIAGNFPCVPSFGGGYSADGITMPPHGWSANQSWEFRKSGEHEGASWALSTMESPESAMPLSFRKIDALLPGQNIHYTSIAVKNSGTTPLEICAGWHNTLGAPFLAEGSRLSACADAWITAPKGSEFDTTSRFVPGAEFNTLKEAPLLNGGKADISVIPGPIGYTDFAAGRVPAGSSLGWSSLVNPALKMTYVCFFTGPGAAAPDDIILRFNDLWMQYGGRPFTPWAAYEGGTDLTYCLGTENSAAAYAQGLDYSRQHKKVLDAPTTVIIGGGEEKILRYGTLFAPYAENVLDEGIDSIEGETSALVCRGKSGFQRLARFARFAADPLFNLLKTLEKEV